MKEFEIGLLRNFSRHEKDISGRQIFHAFEEIDNELMHRIDLAVSFAKEVYGEERGAFIVHDINLGKHSRDSLHNIGKAIDGHFRGINLFQASMILLKMNFNGLGIYPDWKNKGIHADIRVQDHVSTWVCHRNEYIYDWNYFVEQLEMEMECPANDGKVYN